MLDYTVEPSSPTAEAMQMLSTNSRSPISEWVSSLAPVR
jgi:hypothetical protein